MERLGYLPEHHDWGNIEWVSTAPGVDIECLSEELGVGVRRKFVDCVRLAIVLVGLLCLGLGGRHGVV